MNDNFLSKLTLIKNCPILNIPKFVWVSIAESHGIDIEEKSLDQVDYIYRLQRTVNENPVDKKDLSKLATYFNAEEQNWTEKGLISAVEFESKLGAIVVLKNTTIGRPTQSNPEIISPPMACHYALQVNLPFDSSTTVDELNVGLMVWKNNSKVVNLVIKLCMSMIDDRSCRNVFQRPLSHLVHKAFSSRLPTYDVLNVAHTQLVNRNYELPSIKFTLADLICWIAKRYKTNISKYNHPILTAAKLMADVEKSREELSHIADIDIPNVFSTEELNEILKTFGIAPVNNPYPIFANHVLSNKTFYPSHVISHNLKETLIYREDVNTGGNILIYGSYAKADYAVTFTELAEAFRERKSLNCPRAETRFDNHVILRLRYLANNSEHGHSLLSIITMLEATEVSSNEVYRRLAGLSSGEKQTFVGLLNILVECAMYMRSWSGSGGYPIEDAPANPNQEEVDIKVSEVMGKLELKIDEAKDIGKLLLDVPLVIYRNNAFAVPNGADATRTIGERLELVKKGGSENTSSDSCIRISSCWLLCTAVRCQLILGEKGVCNLERLKYIS